MKMRLLPESRKNKQSKYKFGPTCIHWGLAGEKGKNKENETKTKTSDKESFQPGFLNVSGAKGGGGCDSDEKSDKESVQVGFPGVSGAKWGEKKNKAK